MGGAVGGGWCIITWHHGDLPQQSEEQFQGGRLVLPRAGGHGGRQLLQQQDPHLDQT